MALGFEARSEAGRDLRAVTNQSLAQSYLTKVEKRLKALAVLKAEGANSDVVREAQELVELALKGMLRAVGVEPPKFHDVGGLLVEHGAKFVPAVRERLPRAAEISRRLRRGGGGGPHRGIDFLPPERHSPPHAPR